MYSEPNQAKSMAEHMRQEQLQKCLLKGERVDAKSHTFESGSSDALEGMSVYVRAQKEGQKLTFEQCYTRKEWVEGQGEVTAIRLADRTSDTPYHLQTNALVREQATYAVSGKPGEECLMPLTYQMQEDGVKRAELQLMYDAEGNLVGENVYVYDAQGKLEQGAETRLSPEQKTKTILEFGKDGQQTSERVIKVSGLTRNALVSGVGNAGVEMMKGLGANIVWMPTEEVKLRHALKAINLATERE